MGRRWKNAGNNGHVPAARAARLLNVLIQSAVIIVDGVTVRRAVGVDVGNLMMVRAGMVIDMVACEAVVIRALCSGCRFGRRDVGGLRGKRREGRHHHDGSDALERWKRIEVQRRVSPDPIDPQP